MRLSDLKGKRVAILGFGREGKSVANALKRLGIVCDITVRDSSPDARTDGLLLISGPKYLEGLEAYDVVVKSPGIPPHPAIANVGPKLTTATNLFFDSVEDSGASIVGISGSKGKSTTTSLIHAMLLAGGKDAHLVGNIGVPALDHLEKAKKGAIFVHELSSYQLMDMRASPRIAVVTAFFPEHLDYHGSLSSYLDAKKNLTRFQTSDDCVFFSKESHGAAEIAKEGSGRKIPYGAEDAAVELAKTKLIGHHNEVNLGGATLCATYLGVSKKDCAKAAKAFIPLRHRLEPVGTHHGIDWVDDAISTTPESAVAALDALGDKVATMILGWQDRGYDFTRLAERIKDSELRAAIFFPGSGRRIEEALKAADARIEYAHAESMEEAVEKAIRLTPRGKTCLLSTASPSYGMFRNFEEKGEVFQRCVRG
jgi:UDP-N-acetylmuramoyl-L-alanine---L-glutamate ligase